MPHRLTEQTLLEQLQITEADIQQRQALLLLTADDFALLKSLRVPIETRIDDIIEQFYEQQLAIEEVALLIGDADTLNRLRVVQRKYVLDLFSGQYGVEYVNKRLRIGLVHKRMGVGPKLFLAAVAMLKKLLCDQIAQSVAEGEERQLALQALDKPLLYDTTLIFETHIRSMVAEIEVAKERSDHNAAMLEETVRQRTRELEESNRTDPRTGLRNARYLEESLTRAVRAAERRAEPIALVFIDIDEFKAINDVHGHARGDEVLRTVSDAGCCGWITSGNPGRPAPWHRWRRFQSRRSCRRRSSERWRSRSGTRHGSRRPRRSPVPHARPRLQLWTSR